MCGCQANCSRAPKAGVEPDPPRDSSPPTTADKTTQASSLSPEVVARAREFQPIVLRASERFGVAANLLNAIIWHESRFNPKARNPSGAKGLMQLMPRTSKAMAQRLERRNRPLDAEFSIYAGAQLLSIMLERFSGREDLALFAYARGGGSVRAWKRQGGPMPERVRKFIGRIRSTKRAFDALGYPSAAL